MTGLTICVASRPVLVSAMAFPRVVARHHVRHQRLPRYIVEGARHARYAGEQEYLPDMDLPGEGERGDDDGADREDDARDSEQRKAVVAVHQYAVEGREQRSREAQRAIHAHQKSRIRLD